MAGRTTTGIQISGYRFLARRMEHALVRGDVRMLDDPLRAQALSLTAGCVLAIITVAVCAVLAFLQPKGEVGNAAIVVVRESGALYVRIGDTMHPTLNLASARLITGESAAPELVSAAALNRTKRGPLVGIPGAPGYRCSPARRRRIDLDGMRRLDAANHRAGRTSARTSGLEQQRARHRAR